MRKRLRKLQSDSGHSETFEFFETELAARQAEIARCRADAAAFELTVRDLTLQLETLRNTGGGETHHAEVP